MKFLLDTHIALWWLTGSEKLPAGVVMFLEKRDNELFVSVASIWEVAIKHLSRPEDISLSEYKFAKYCETAGFKILPIEVEHIFNLRTLARPERAPRHHDPFDRIMLAQAKAEKMFFLTHDTLLSDYGEKYVLML